MFYAAFAVYLRFPTCLLLISLTCHCTSTEEAAAVAFGRGELYAVTGDSGCRPSSASNCDLGAVMTWTPDSVSYYYPVEKVYTTHPYTRVHDTLLVGVRKQRLILRNTGDKVTLTDPVRHRIYTLAKLAGPPPIGQATLLPVTSSMHLADRGFEMLIHPPMECNVSDSEGYPVFVFEGIAGDTAQYTDVMGIRRVNLPGHELLDLGALGLLYRYGKQPNRGAYRLINGIGQIASGLLSLDVPYFQPIQHDLRGVWNSSTEVTLASLQAANQRGFSARLGLSRDAYDTSSADPLVQLSPNSSYRFGLEVDEEFSLYLTLNGDRLMHFPSLYHSTQDDGLILGENASCQLFALDDSDGKNTLTTLLLLGFTGEPDGQRYPVNLRFDRMER